MAARTATCAFCGLLCDDLEVDVVGATLRPLRGACERATAAYATLGTDAATRARPRVAGRPVDFDEALDAAAALLRAGRRPVISGLDVDVAGMRSVLALARRLGAVVDHVHGPVKYRNLHALQEGGAITTTLAEARNRADLMILIGTGWHRRFPRFVERIIAPEPFLGGTGAPRRIVTVDAIEGEARRALPANVEHLPLDAAPGQLPAVVAMLGALADRQPVDAGRITGVAPGTLERCVDWMRAARYGVVVWSAADLDWPHAELTVQALARCIRSLNRDTRFVGLPLAGTDGDLTANAVQTWQAGVPLPASYANGRVDFDPSRHALPRVLARGEADLLIWVSSLGHAPPPLSGSLPRVVLGRADLVVDHGVDVFIPVATPGIDAAGHLLRTDKVVTLYLPRVRVSTLPSAASVVDALAGRLG